MAAISHRNKCAFIHIPKTAGRSIMRSLGGSSLKTKKMVVDKYKEEIEYFNYEF